MTGASAAARARRAIVGEWFESGDDRSERLGVAPSGQERFGGADDLERVRLARIARVSPCGDAVAAEDDADRFGVGRVHGRDLEAELESRAPPRHPYDAITEALLGQSLAVGRRRQRDPGVRMEVIDVGGVDEAVHGRVDRRCCAAASVQAVVEGGDHLVFSIDAGIDVGQRADAIEPEHGETFLRQRTEVAAGALHPQQLDRSIGDGIDLLTLRRGVPAGVVRVAGIGAEPVRPRDQLLDNAHAPQPAWVPPTRSSHTLS